MYRDEQPGGIKVYLRCREDFLSFYTQLSDAMSEREPTTYPCMVVQWDGSDNGYWEDYEFVYPQDIYPMLQ